MSASAAKRISECKKLALKVMPHLGRYLICMTDVPSDHPSLTSMGVDRHYRLYYRPRWAESAPDGEIVLTILHETAHLWLRHFDRGERILGHDSSPQRFRTVNIAADAALWAFLADLQSRFDKAGIAYDVGKFEQFKPAALGLDDNGSMETYFAKLLQKEQQQQEQQQQEEPDDDDDDDQGEDEPQMGQGGEDQDDEDDCDSDGQGEGQDEDDQGGEDSADGGNGGEPDGEQGGEDGDGDAGDSAGDNDGQGGGQGDAGDADGGPGSMADCQDFGEFGGSVADGQPRPWELPFDDEDAPGLPEHQARVVERAVAETIAKSIGKVGGQAALEWAGSILKPPVDPRKELAAKLRHASRQVSGFGQRSYRRHNPRSTDDVMLPVEHRLQPKLHVVLDTSGSMGASDYAKALGFLEHAMRKCRIRNVSFHAGDTEIASEQDLHDYRKVRLIGGGGTDMGKIVTSLCERRRRDRPELIVVLTDGMTPWCKTVSVPTIAVITSGSACPVPDCIKAVNIANAS